MKHFHVHVSVQDMDASVRFYSTLFGVPPSVTKEDYAKWMLDDPRVNFAISRRGRAPGVNHLGLQVDSGTELAALEARLRAADAALETEHDVTCCYARSDKYWVEDPQGVAWETFHTLAEAPVYGDAPAEPLQCCQPAAGAEAQPAAACCEPAAKPDATPCCSPV
jgi:catechol 2,3-dioxygenase-like lactoylglutathione lyase family enzyme